MTLRTTGMAAIAGLILAATAQAPNALAQTAPAQKAPATGPTAVAPGAHPHYMEALTDLRLAHALLKVPDPTHGEKFEKTAANQLEQAIGEMKQAAIDDGKSIDDHAPIDANVSHKDRLHEILTLVHTAEIDLNAEEDDKKALGWRNRALKDVADARAFVEAAVANEK